ncbi:MAG: sialidase family protein [Muribaculaceae bacterium]
MKKIYAVICALSFIFNATSCVKNEDSIKVDKGDDLTIEWDSTSAVCVSEEGVYARIHRLTDENLMCVYEDFQGNTYRRKSINNGKSWSEAKVMVPAFFVKDNAGKKVKIRVANAEFIQLSSGELIYGCNLRPEIDNVFPFTIAVCRSKDFGETWTEIEYIYQAGKSFKDGCWEPSFLELPNGTIQVYFANEAPYINSNEQEISVIESKDKGETWNNMHQVCFRANFRDGMPVPIIAQDSIYVAIEDNGFNQFKPYIVKTAIANNWSSPVLANSLNRIIGIKAQLHNSIYAGAPYLIKTDNYFVMSYQTNYKRAADWEKSTMEVVVSKKPFDMMGGTTRPFSAVPLDKEAKWNSLMNMGNDKVAAIASTNFSGSKIGIWMIIGSIKENKK